MKVHQLTIDSGQRDPSLYPNPNDYTVELEKPIYNVSNIKLVSARIPTPQLPVCATNNNIVFRAKHQDGTIFDGSLSLTDSPSHPLVTGPQITGAFSSIGAGYDFEFSYDATRNKLIIGQPKDPNGINLQQLTFFFKTGQDGYDDSSSEHTTMHQVLGFLPQDVDLIGGAATDFSVMNLNGPNSLVLRISSGSDQLSQSLPTAGQTPFYTSHILLNGTDFVNFNGTDDKVTHDFHSGPLISLSDLRFEFFYMSHGRLIRYDFRQQDHVLKFEVTCSTDKLENLIPLELPSSPEKKAVNIPEETKRNLYDFEFKTEYLYIMLIVFTGLTLVLTMGKRRA